MVGVIRSYLVFEMFLLCRGRGRGVEGNEVPSCFWASPGPLIAAIVVTTDGMNLCEGFSFYEIGIASCTSCTVVQ